MEIKDIRRLLDAVAAADVNEFSYETGDFKLTVRRSLRSNPDLVHGRSTDLEILRRSDSSLDSPPVPDVIPNLAGQSEASSVTPDLYEVRAPIVGTFYAAPAPEVPPYVKVGDRVEEGTVLCIIEAMKLMNEIEAERAGTVVEILVRNEEPVEYGQALFRIELQ